MKVIEWDVDTEGEPVVVFYDEAGKVQFVQRGAGFYEDEICYIISDKTITELEAILKQAGKSWTFKQKRKLYFDFNTCLRFYELAFALGSGTVEKQTALNNLIKAFEALGDDGQRTLLETFFLKGQYGRKRGGLHHFPQTYFLEAARSLLTKTPKQGRPRDYGTETKILLARCAWDLFEELGIKTATTNTGHLARFVSVLWNDPALNETYFGSLKGSPSDLRDYLREIKKDKEKGRSEKGGELE